MMVYPSINVSSLSNTAPMQSCAQTHCGPVTQTAVLRLEPTHGEGDTERASMRGEVRLKIGKKSKIEEVRELIKEWETVTRSDSEEKVKEIK